MGKHFNIAVLGSGPGGYVAALKAAQMGATTAVVERHPFFGGTCLNWGCIPSKALLAGAELMHHIQHAEEFGIEIQGQISHNWPVMQARKDKILKSLRGGIKGLFGARKITPYQGTAVLEAPGRIAVMRDGQKVDELTADKIILGLGSAPVRLPGWPDDPERIATSDEALHWKTLPSKLLIVGGGVIGCEFACMLRALGLEITIVEMMAQLLPGMDGHLAQALQKSLEGRGIRILTATKVEDLKLTDRGVKATLDNGEALEIDRVLVSIGRRPETKAVGLETLGIELTPRGFVRANDRMETSLAGHYAIGDCNGKCLLAHAASAHGVVAAENALGHTNEFTAPVPSCVYTFPEVAAVGMSEERARELGLPIRIGAFPLQHLGKAMAAGDTEGFVKVIRHRGSDEILGVHMLGHNVTEVIAAAGALLHQKATTTEVAETVFAHPTISEALKEAAEDALGMALHLPPKKMMRVKVGS